MLSSDYTKGRWSQEIQKYKKQPIKECNYEAIKNKYQIQNRKAANYKMQYKQIIIYCLFSQKLLNFLVLQKTM